MTEEPDIVKELRSLEKQGKMNGLNDSSYFYRKSIQMDNQYTDALTYDDHSPSQKEEYDLIDRALLGDEKNRTLFHWSPTAIVIVNNQRILVDANQKLYEWLGYKPEEVIGKDVLDLPFISMEDKKILSNNFMLRMKGESISPYEIEFSHRNKTKKWGEIHGILLKDELTDVTLDIIMIIDITKRKHTMQRLRESEVQFRALAESAYDAVISANQQGIITFVNPAAEKTFGYHADELVRKSLTTIIPTNVREKFSERMSTVLSNQDSLFNRTLEMTGLRKDGSEFPVEMSISPWKVGNDVYFTAILRDITERKHTIQRLKDSEEKFRQFFECSPDYCYMISSEGNIIDINENALKILGYEKEHIVGKQLIPTIYPSSAQEKAKQLTQKWSKQGYLRNEELIIVTKQGEIRHVLLGVANVKDSNGTLLYSILMQKDITERKESEEILKQSEDKYKTIFENSHDLLQYVGEDGRFLEVNPQWLHTLGYSKKELHNLSLQNIIKEDQIPHCMEIFQRIKNGETAKNISTIFITKSGKEIPVEGFATGQFKDEKFISTIGIFREISTK